MKPQDDVWTPDSEDDVSSRHKDKKKKRKTQKRKKSKERRQDDHTLKSDDTLKSEDADDTAPLREETSAFSS